MPKKKFEEEVVKDLGDADDDEFDDIPEEDLEDLGDEEESDDGDGDI